MKLRHTLTCIYLMAGLLVSSHSSAEPTIERSAATSLSSLTMKVHERQLASLKQNAQQQQIDANTALGNALFAGAANINLNHFNDAIGSSDGMQEWESSVDLPLWLPGQKQQQLALSETLSAEIPVYQQRQLLDASGTVRSTVWAVVLAETKLKQSYQVWQTAQSLEQNVVSRVKAGELAGTEGLLASSHALEMQGRYLQAKTELDYAWNNYQNYTGEITLPEKIEESLSTQVTISQKHPYLALLDQQLLTLRAQQDLAQFDGAVNPNLSFGLRRERDGHDDDYNNSVGIGISFALDNEVYQNPNLANAASVLADATIERQRVKRKLQDELLRLQHQLQAKQQQLELVNQQDKTAQQYLLLQQRAFDLGEIDLVSLLRSQSLADQAVNRKTSLQVSIKHAISTVNQALGLVP
jgi:cobalt-zinc-cadmium efflux system outer membrane protein